MSKKQAVHNLDPVGMPPPAHFPVIWADPGDERLLWMQDRMHAPGPIPPLEGEFWDLVYEGFNLAAQAYAMPIKVKARRINTYFYMAVSPLEIPDNGTEAKMTAAMARLGENWEREWLPEIRSHLAWWDGFDRQAATDAELLAHLEETLTRSRRLWEIHFLINFPGYVAMSQFDELYRDLFAGSDALDSYLLLQGHDNKTVETGREIWKLSRLALASAEVSRILSTYPPEQTLLELEKSSAGREFNAELRTFLETYGYRGDKWGLRDPSWVDDPAPVIRNLREYIGQPDLDPVSRQERLAVEREQAVAAARARLQGYPQPVAEQFKFLLKAASWGVVLSEDHGFWIDFGSVSRIRRVIMEFGRRLAVAGVIERPDDVFFLTFSELRQATVDLPSSNLRRRVAVRRGELERFGTVTPPPVLGADPGQPPDDPVNRMLGKLFGGPPPPAENPDVLRGSPGSRGKVSGPAKVIRSLSEAWKLRRGDVLVAETTAPPWTPLFAVAAAVVTDTGGNLSHCAVVAREYRIPAVVGAGCATARIRDGQVLEVDGDAGTVRILSD